MLTFQPFYSLFPRLWCSFLFATASWSHFHYTFFHFLLVLSRNVILKRKITRCSFTRKHSHESICGHLEYLNIAVCDWLKWTMAYLHLICLGQWRCCFSPHFLNNIYYETVGTLPLNWYLY